MKSEESILVTEQKLLFIPRYSLNSCLTSEYTSVLTKGKESKNRQVKRPPVQTGALCWAAAAQPPSHSWREGAGRAAGVAGHCICRGSAHHPWLYQDWQVHDRVKLPGDNGQVSCESFPCICSHKCSFQTSLPRWGDRIKKRNKNPINFLVNSYLKLGNRLFPLGPYPLSFLTQISGNKNKWRWIGLDL